MSRSGPGDATVCIAERSIISALRTGESDSGGPKSSAHLVKYATEETTLLALTGVGVDRSLLLLLPDPAQHRVQMPQRS